MKDPYSHRDWIMAKLCNATSEEHAINLEYLVASQMIRPLFADSEWQDETYPIMVDAIPSSGTTMEKAMAQDMQLLLQEDIIDRPKKGFGVPIGAWLHGDFSEVIRELMDDSFIKVQGIFDNREIQRFYQRFLLDNNVILDKIMWSYMIFQLWYRQNCLHRA